eukprot:3729566-Rhodomonas_salina.2
MSMCEAMCEASIELGLAAASHQYQEESCTPCHGRDIPGPPDPDSTAAARCVRYLVAVGHGLCESRTSHST